VPGVEYTSHENTKPQVDEIEKW